MFFFFFAVFIYIIIDYCYIVYAETERERGKERDIITIFICICRKNILGIFDNDGIHNPCELYRYDIDAYSTVHDPICSIHLRELFLLSSFSILPLHFYQFIVYNRISMEYIERFVQLRLIWNIFVVVVCFLLQLSRDACLCIIIQYWIFYSYLLANHNRVDILFPFFLFVNILLLFVCIRMQNEQ